MNVVVRADASDRIGTGHVMRCLTLADLLRSRGARVTFACRSLPGDLCDVIERGGHGIRRLAGPGRPGVDWRRDAAETAELLAAAGERPRWLVVDHYGLDRRWERELRPRAANIMVIDDLADRPHDCEVLLDQNLHRDPERRYRGLVPGHCRTFFGPEHALLRPEFARARRSLRTRTGELRRLLICFGGADPTQETAKALEALSLLAAPPPRVDVVLGSSNPRTAELRERCARLANVTCHCGTDAMASLMAAADCALGAAGSSAWERCFLGLPSILVVAAPNQEGVAAAVAGRGAAVNLGPAGSVTPQAMAAALRTLGGDAPRLVLMGGAAAALMGPASADRPSGLLRAIEEAADAPA